METFQPLSLDFVPDPGAPRAALLQNEQDAFLIFNAVGCGTGRRPRENFLAFFTFDLCHSTRFGYPNDEPRASIPRYKNIFATIVEVSQSEWAAEVQAQNRIGFPEGGLKLDRHFLFQFKDSTFECLCDGFEVELTNEPRIAVIERIAKQLR